MDSEQYDIMAHAEDHHWWYLGLRDAISQCLCQNTILLPAHPKILDAGCGTGANLRFLESLLQPSHLEGFDKSSRAIAYAKRKAPFADLYLADLCSPEIKSGDFDLILSCDVLYVPGVEKAFQGLLRLIDALKVGGIFVWNLPAYNWLTSYHDRAVHTRERFTRESLESLNYRLGLKCHRISYRLHSLLPFLILKRISATVCDRKVHSDLSLPNPWVNRLLYHVLQFENRLIANGLSLPWGSSVFAVCEKL